MPETVTIGGKQFPKTMVYGAGALTVGIVGYAWFTKGKTGSPPTSEELSLPEPVPVPTDETDFSVSGGGPPPTTNAQWSENAISKLIGIGLDGAAVSGAIGKFLQRKHLNIIEQSLIQQAIGVAGYPPQDGPWYILEEGPATNTPTPTPSGPSTQFGLLVGAPSISAAHDRIDWAWNPVTNASYYTIQPVAVSQGKTLALDVTDKTSWSWYYANPSEQYSITVVAYDSNQREIDRDTGTATT